MANAANNYVGKLVMAVLLTPLVHLGHAAMERYLNRHGSPLAPGAQGRDLGQSPLARPG